MNYEVEDCVGEAILNEPKVKLCEVCSERDSKYTCPRCYLRTCCLKCCLSHKENSRCTGKRDRTAFVNRKDYHYLNFLSDYRLLEAIDRENENREKQLAELRVSARNRQGEQSKLAIAARSLGIDFRAVSTFLTRGRLNRTRIESPTSELTPLLLPTIFWTIEFCLLPIPDHFPLQRQSQGLTSLRSDRKWSNYTIKPINIFVHSCHPDSTLEIIWHDKVVNLSSDDQHKLLFRATKTAHVKNRLEQPNVSNWLLADSKYEGQHFGLYFYIQCEEIVNRIDSPQFSKKTYPKHEVFPTTLLKDVLTRAKYVVHEFPTIWVSRVDIPTYLD